MQTHFNIGHTAATSENCWQRAGSPGGLIHRPVLMTASEVNVVGSSVNPVIDRNFEPHMGHAIRPWNVFHNWPRPKSAGCSRTSGKQRSYRRSGWRVSSRPVDLLDEVRDTTVCLCSGIQRRILCIKADKAFSGRPPKRSWSQHPVDRERESGAAVHLWRQQGSPIRKSHCKKPGRFPLYPGSGPCAEKLQNNPASARRSVNFRIRILLLKLNNVKNHDQI